MPRPGTPESVRKQMVDLYLRGHTLAGAADAFGMTTKAARNALMKAGVERRVGGNSRGIPYTDLTGRVFGRLTVIGPHAGNLGRAKGSAFLWDCRCECGKLTVVGGGKFGDGHTQSCGCLRIDVNKKMMTTHGMTGTSAYSTWQRIIQRCTNPRCTDWHGYGGRGITICDGLRDSFLRFIKLLGDKPSEQHSVDRIDNESGYFCGVCEECVLHERTMNLRWSTPKDQARNTRASIRITFNGRTQNLKDWSIEKGIRYSVLHTRLCNGWSVDKLLTTPAKKRGQKIGRAHV